MSVCVSLTRGEPVLTQRNRRVWGDPMPAQHILFVDEIVSRVNGGAHIILPPPKGQPLHEVFVEAILEDTSAHQRCSPLD